MSGEGGQPQTAEDVGQIGWHPSLKRWLAGAVPSTGSVRMSKPCVALTFDDGPDPEVTPRALDTLASLGAKATFFMLASRAETSPALVRRVLAEGHEIGLHGAWHLALREASTPEVIRCIAGGRHRLEQITHAPVRLFRPPFGRQDLRSYLIARASRMQVIAWNVQVDDWVDRPEEIAVSRLRSSLGPGAIVLLHDGLMLDLRQQEVEPSFDRGAMVDDLIGVMREQDLEGVTVSDLIAMGSPVRFPWFE